MNTKNVVIGVVVVVVIGLLAYFVPKSSLPSILGKWKSAAPADQASGVPAATDQVQGQEVTVGTGAEAKPGTIVTVDYVGKLTDGTVFDSSIERKQPLVFTLGAEGIIPGFQVGVNGMKVGGERLLSIPPSLGYGAQQVGAIPPNSTLIFDVKLLKVEEPVAATPAPATTDTKKR